MAKAKQPRRLADNEAQAFLKSCKSSAQKARLVLDMIRGENVEKALADLTFSKKAIVAAPSSNGTFGLGSILNPISTNAIWFISEILASSP